LKIYQLKALQQWRAFSFPLRRIFTKLHSQTKRMPMRRLYIFCLLASLLLSPELGTAQQNDSLERFVNNAPNDTIKANALNDLCQRLTNTGEFKVAKRYGTQALELSNNLKFDRGIANANNNLGVVLESQGNYTEALRCHETALKIRKAKGSKKEIAASYNNIGNVYYLQGKFAEALKFYSMALQLKKNFSTKKSLINAYNNIGNVYSRLDKTEQALLYYDSTLSISKELNNGAGMANANNNIALIYERQGKNSDAYEMYSEVRKIAESSGDKVILTVATVNLSAVLLKMKRFPEARRNCLEALKLSREMGSREYMKESYLNLSMVDSAQGNARGQLDNFKRYVELSDSLDNEENERRATEREVQFDFAKKAAADSVKNAEKLKLEEVKHDKEISRQKLYTYAGVIGITLMLIATLISLRAFRQKRRANEQITEQKMMLDEKQKEILDSIHYAKRIQRSFFPTDLYMDKNINRLKK
jgi:tetratricopeptide (TPR) repeat protein